MRCTRLMVRSAPMISMTFAGSDHTSIFIGNQSKHPPKIQRALIGRPALFRGCHAACFQSMTIAIQAFCFRSRQSRYGAQPRSRSFRDTSAASAVAETVKPALIRPLEDSTNTRRRPCCIAQSTTNYLLSPFGGQRSLGQSRPPNEEDDLGTAHRNSRTRRPRGRAIEGASSPDELTAKHGSLAAGTNSRGPRCILRGRPGMLANALPFYLGQHCRSGVGNGRQLCSWPNVPLELGNGLARGDGSAINLDIVFRHALGRKAPLECSTNGSAVQLRNTTNCGDGLLNIVDDESGDGLLDHFRHRSATERDHGRTACHRLDHDQPEGLRPIDREKQGNRVAKEFRLFLLVDFADELDLCIGAHHWLDLLTPIGLIDPVHLCGDLERHAGLSCNFNRQIGPFFGRYPTQEYEITLTGITLEWQKITRQSVMYCANPICVTQISALVPRNRDQWHFVKYSVKERQIRQIQSTMMGRYCRARQLANQGGMQIVYVEMQDFEFVGSLPNLLHHDHMIRQRVPDGGVEPQRHVATRHELGGCF